MTSKITGIILAGGRGTRLKPLTDVTSKQLLPVGGKPMVVRVIEKMKLAGIESIVVVIDERHASEYFSELKDGSDFGVEIVYVWQDNRGGGIPSAILLAKKAVKTDKIFVACGDVMIDANLKKIVGKFEQQEVGAALVYTKVDDTAGYSAISVGDGIIKDIFSKNTSLHQEGLIDLGMYFYSQDVFGRIPYLKVSERGETEVWDLNRTYILEDQLHGLEIEGWWSDAGYSIEEYLLVNKHFYGTAQ